MKRLSIRRKHSKRLGKKGYWAGYKRGREQGSRFGQASFGKVFEGVSIIIPSCNQLHQLRACIHRIEEHTSHPHEIIVVDSGSTDGTRTYLLRKSIAVRYALLKKDVHMLGNLNQGLMMAKGTTIAVLDPHVMVTPGWLDRLLECLYSDPRLGVIGPVTNGPFGAQQIEVPYINKNEAFPFAKTYNISNPAAWRETESLAGFCLLLRRETLEKTGYWDEGCHSSQEAAEDWLLRVRLLGIRMAIAGDAFIHYAGSDRDTVYAFLQSTGKSGSMEESSQNRSFFVQKWGDMNKLLHSQKIGTAKPDEQLASAEERRVSAASFYPVGALVQGPSGAVFRLEPGRRRFLQRVRAAGSEYVTPVRISQLDLLALPLVPKPEVLVSGDTEVPVVVPPEEPIPVLAACEPESMPMLTTHNTPAQRKQWIEVLYAEGRQLYQIGNGWKRPFLTPYAAMSWRAADYRIQLLSPGDLSALVEERPIIAPPVLHRHL
ncbi:glycosyltransferase family 2 protein [Paenibacillus peoriae]|uniref:glycosyltransferase family 2 protein n=1 Tax=Paenibacillus peoriae TaxID=59893 RepID=UPI00026C6637|nr:glycosyltransferase family 2 protein [Paenibacillus peoriae]MEC0182661.1 glycosyltransferase family 2 protein [Paenibacillus peoriae]